MKRWMALVLIIVSACTAGTRDDRQTVVAGFYPIAEAARHVGARVRVVDLVPPGAEPHDIELTTKQASDVVDADLVILLGDGFQPAVEELARTRKGPTLKLLDHVPSRNGDPHVWLDPLLMRVMTSRIAESMGLGTSPTALEYERELYVLHKRYERGLSSCARHEIVTSHASFGYLAERYGLAQLPIAGVSPESEPSPSRLAELASIARRDHVTTIFTETLVSPRVAQTLAREARVKTAVLDPVEGIRRGSRDTYISTMDRNLRTLRKALGCR